VLKGLPFWINQFKIIGSEEPITGWLFYRVFPTPTQPQAARANTSSLAFIDFAWITPIAYRVDPVNTYCHVEPNSGPSKAYLEDLFTADYYSSPASLEYAFGGPGGELPSPSATPFSLGIKLQYVYYIFI